MFQLLDSLQPYFLLHQLPGGHSAIFLLLVKLVLVLETVVGEMDHQFFLTLHVLLSIVLNGQSKIALVEKNHTGTAVVEEVAPNVEFLFREEEGVDVVLDQSVLLEILVFARLRRGLVGSVEFRFVVNHVVESELAKVKLFGLNELPFEGFNVANQTYPLPLIEIPRFIDPYSFGSVVYEVNLVGHHVQPVSLGDESIHARVHLLPLPLQFKFKVFQGLQQFQLMSDHAYVRDVVDNLFAFFEGVEVNFSRALYPFEEEMRRKLFLVSHQVELLPVLKIVRNQLAIVALAHKDLPGFHLTAVVEVHVVEGRVCKDREFVTQPLVGPFVQPFVFLAVRHECSLEPAVQGPIVELDIVVES